LIEEQDALIRLKFQFESELNLKEFELLKISTAVETEKQKIVAEQEIKESHLIKEIKTVSKRPNRAVLLHLLSA